MLSRRRFGSVTTRRPATPATAAAPPTARPTPDAVCEIASVAANAADGARDAAANYAAARDAGLAEGTAAGFLFALSADARGATTARAVHEVTAGMVLREGTSG